MAVRSNKFHRWCIWEDWLKILGNQGPKWDADQGEPGLFSRTWSKFGGLGIRRKIYKACVVSNFFYTTFPPSGQLIPTWIVLMLFISGVCAQSQIYPLLYLGGHATRVGKNKQWTGSNSVAGILAKWWNPASSTNYNFWGTFCVYPYDTLHA